MKILTTVDYIRMISVIEGAKVEVRYENEKKANIYQLKSRTLYKSVIKLCHVQKSMINSTSCIWDLLSLHCNGYHNDGSNNHIN